MLTGIGQATHQFGRPEMPMREGKVNVARGDDVHLADLTPGSCLLVLLTVAAAFSSVLLIVLWLPPEWVERVPKATFAVPVATVGVAVFWFGARVLGRFGFRVLRQRGEPKIVAISFGIILSIIGVPLGLGTLALFFAKGSLEAPALLVGGGGILFIVAGFLLTRSAIKTQRAERRDTEKWVQLGNEMGGPWHRSASEAVDGREGHHRSAEQDAAADLAITAANRPPRNTAP